MLNSRVPSSFLYWGLGIKKLEDHCITCCKKECPFSDVSVGLRIETKDLPHLQQGVVYSLGHDGMPE